ncbi:MAG: DUF6044 family protein [Lachnospiraceae bacterium]|nr:DUF6044 family protein [Lachnospiraceae bacterium]
MKKILKNWHLILIGAFILFAGLIFLISGENSIISVHDNLDLFVPQYQMMKDTGTFFSQNTYVGFLADIGRDYLPSEFNLYTAMFMIMPSYYAYVVCYLLKIVIAVVGAVLLGKEYLGDKYKDYSRLVYLVGFAYGILNLFPNFGIAFASLPLFLFIMSRIIKKPNFFWYLALFAYPLISYFSYIGIFIIGYMFIYFIIRWIVKKKFPWQILIAIPVLCAGFVLCEYRLFYTMLFSDIESIRTSMVLPSLSFGEVLASIWEGFAIGDMHTESMQLYFILPVCLGWFIFETVTRIKKHEGRTIFKDIYNGILLFIFINSIIYGLYNCEGVRTVFETIIPPLKGFEFGRAQFLNPCLWYIAFFMVLVRIYIRFPKFKWIADIMAVISIAIIVLAGTRYNDLFHTTYDKLYSATHDGAHTNDLSYKEFYSEELFDEIKEDIGYCGQWSVAYGLYPAILEYNGIRTLDGYLGYYPEFYKKEFRKIIAPALDRIPESQSYFDNWGARCYLYSGTNPTIISAGRNYDYESEDIYINLNALKEFGGRYIFSRVEITNAAEAGLTLVKKYENASSPYTIYLYQTTSRYMDSVHSHIPFEERTPTYDIDRLEEICKELTNYVEEINNYKNNNSELSDAEILDAFSDKEASLINLVDEGFSQLNDINTAYTLYMIEFYKDSSNEELDDLMNELMDHYMEGYDSFLQVLREVASSPYKSSLNQLFRSEIVDAFTEYEDMEDEDKDRQLKLQSLKAEYTQASLEEYYYDYEGKTWSMNDLYALMASGDPTVTQDDIVNIYQGIMAEKASVLGDIYIQIRNINNEIAKEEDYDNYAEYAYANIFVRDYSVDDVKTLCKDLRDYCIEYLSRANSEFSELKQFDPGFITENDTATYEALLPYMKQIDPELGESMQYMLDYNLYDLKVSDAKADLGFTTYFKSYGDPYIYNKPYMNSTDFNTFIHEFGHFNNYFHVQENIFESRSNLDTSEIDSQALVMLMLPYLHEMFPEPIGSFFEQDFTVSLMQAIISACTVAEFEIWAYENPDSTLDELCIKYKELQEEYGTVFYENITKNYEWININHLFEQPLYYISYATSALTSLQIYNLSKENYHTAVEKYMELSSYKSYWFFKELTTYVGFEDVFKKGEAKNIFKSTYLNLRKNFYKSKGN